VEATAVTTIQDLLTGQAIQEVQVVVVTDVTAQLVLQLLDKATQVVLVVLTLAYMQERAVAVRAR
jgi:hypothetical protein